MNKLKRFLLSTYRNVILKGKFRPFLLIIFDKSFREDIERLSYLTRKCTKVRRAVVQLRDLGPGHRVVYPKYVKGLKASTILMSDNRLRVVSDGVGYTVVDGNHRLACLKQWCEPDQFLYVDLMY